MKEAGNFYKNGKSLSSRCIDCAKIATARNRRDRAASDPEYRKVASRQSKVRKKPYIKHKDATCRCCGFIPLNKCQLTVDHIDKNHKNNEVSNLQTLCHNCHNLKSYLETREPEKLIILNLVPSTS